MLIEIINLPQAISAASPLTETRIRWHIDSSKFVVMSIMCYLHNDRFSSFSYERENRIY